MARFYWLLAALFLLTGCGTKATDYPLASGQKNQPQAPVTPGPGRPMVVLAFSGGGSRAAALAAAVVDRLNRLTYTEGGETRTLADDIDVVSSVSGGSVYNADLGLNGPAHAAEFKKRIQDFDGIGWLERKALNPFTWFSLAGAGGTRVDLQQQMLEELLHTNGATMASLSQPGRPVTLFNATDMIAGQVFTFDRVTIDDLCMDYDKVPVSLGVNASAAVPGIWTPVLLRNDSYPDLSNPAIGCQGAQVRGSMLPYRTALSLASGAYINPENFRDARYRQALRNEPVTLAGSNVTVGPYRTPEYLRLVDGGVADNSGLTALRRALLGSARPADIGRLAQQGNVRQVVVIIVNAGGDSKSDLDTSPKYTTLVETASGSIDTLIGSASTNAAMVFQDFITQIAAERDQYHGTFRIYPITIDFDQMPITTPWERDAQRYVKSIATSWTLKPGDVAWLDYAAGTLLWRHPCFNDLVTDMRLKGTPEATRAPDTLCPIAQPPK